MAHQASWNDPLVTWDSLLYSWDGNHVESASVESRLRQSSVFAHITEQRLYARVADGH